MINMFLLLRKFMLVHAMCKKLLQTCEPLGESLYFYFPFAFVVYLKERTTRVQLYFDYDQSKTDLVIALNVRF